LITGEPVCGVLGEQSFDDSSQPTGVQARRRFPFNDRKDGVEQRAPAERRFALHRSEQGCTQ
jgi:hypothetical protein